jgi:hypothetical protein
MKPRRLVFALVFSAVVAQASRIVIQPDLKSSGRAAPQGVASSPGPAFEDIGNGTVQLTMDPSGVVGGALMTGALARAQGTGPTGASAGTGNSRPPEAVPEPDTFALFATGSLLLAAGFWYRRRRGRDRGSRTP